MNLNDNTKNIPFYDNIYVSNKYMTAPLVNARRDLVVAAIVGLLISALLAVSVSKNISRPIIQLMDGYGL
jgi:hypothetical protein